MLMATNTDPPSDRSYERERVSPKSGAHLPRLAPEHYRARAFVHWTLTIDQRATGWLTPSFHHAWQLTLLHASARYNLVCPCYVLMPDHIHVLWLGLSDDSDQRLAVTFLRKHLRPNLTPHNWQAQSYDHVLRDTERDQGAFETIAHYIFENPVRAGLTTKWTDYAYVGNSIPGYPDLEISRPDYWELFWRIHGRLAAAPRATRSRS